MNNTLVDFTFFDSIVSTLLLKENSRLELNSICSWEDFMGQASELFNEDAALSTFRTGKNNEKPGSYPLKSSNMMQPPL
jgi:hypothetical protein